jgi:hypothetical protein
MNGDGRDPRPMLALFAVLVIAALGSAVSSIRFDHLLASAASLAPFALGAVEDLTYNFLVGILPAPVKPEWQTQLRRAVSEAALGSPSTADVLSRLAASEEEDARAVARAVEVHASGGIARLALGGPESELPEVGDAQLVSLRIRNLSLPLPGTARGELSEEERTSLAVLRLLAAYALRLCATDTTRHAVLAMDEAWALTSDAQGRALLERISRLGRSQNITPILATRCSATPPSWSRWSGRSLPSASRPRPRRDGPWSCSALTPAMRQRSSACSATEPGAATCATSTARSHRCRSTRRSGCSASSIRRHGARPPRPRGRGSCRGLAVRRLPRVPRRAVLALVFLSALCLAPSHSRAAPPRHTPAAHRQDSGAGHGESAGRANAKVAPAPPTSSAESASAATAPDFGASGQVDPLSGLGIRNPVCDQIAQIRERRTRLACEESGAPEADYPASNYGFDIFISTGVSHPVGDITYAFATVLNGVWLGLIFVLRLVFALLGLAFGLNPFSDGQTMIQISAALERLYAGVTDPWLSTLIVCGGIWFAYKGLLRREAAAALAGTLAAIAMLIVGLWVVHQPRASVGRLAGLADEAALGVISAPQSGSLARPSGTYAEAMSASWSRLVEVPFAGLDFSTCAGRFHLRPPRPCRRRTRSSATTLAHSPCSPYSPTSATKGPRKPAPPSLASATGAPAG